MAPRRCPIHGTVVCPLSEGAPVQAQCRECQRAVERIKAGKAQYAADKELEEFLLDRALRGVRESIRHVLAIG